MRFVHTSLGVIAAVALVALSAFMNYQFWYGLGSHPREAYAMGGASVAFDVLKALLPIWIASALTARKVFYPIIASAIFGLLLVGSVCSAIGFVSSARGEKLGSRDAVNARYTIVKAELADLDSKLARLSGYPPIDTVEAKLSGLRQDRRWTSSKGCEDATATASREFCKQYMDNKAQLASATEAKRLSDRRDDVHAEASRLLAAGAGQDADPQASMITTIISKVRPGFEVSDVKMALVLVFVLLVELCAAFGLFLATRHSPKTPKPEKKAPSQPANDSVALRPEVREPMNLVAFSNASKPGNPKPQRSGRPRALPARVESDDIVSEDVIELEPERPRRFVVDEAARRWSGG